MYCFFGQKLIMFTLRLRRTLILHLMVSLWQKSIPVMFRRRSVNPVWSGGIMLLYSASAYHRFRYMVCGKSSSSSMEPACVLDPTRLTPREKALLRPEPAFNESPLALKECLCSKKINCPASRWGGWRTEAVLSMEKSSISLRRIC